MPLDLLSKTEIKESLPSSMEEVVLELKKSNTKAECLKKAYDILITKYRGHRLKTYTKFFRLFIHDIELLWNESGFMHCTNINYVLRTLLIKSGHFTEDDIRIKWTTVWYMSPHQYLRIKTGDKYVNVDVWGYVYGIKYGDYAYGYK